MDAPRNPRIVVLALLGSALGLASGCERPVTVAYDPAFRVIVPAGARPRKLVDGLALAEGVAWDRERARLVVSDVNGDRLWTWSAREGPRVARAPAGHPNGNAFDGQGRLLTCEHGGRRVVRARADGTLEELAARFGDARLHSPNDVVVAPDGGVWFTDPPYGPRGADEREYEGSGVFRVGPDGALALAWDGLLWPNGIALAPDGTTLFVGDSGARDAPGGRGGRIWALAVGADGTLSDPRPFGSYVLAPDDAGRDALGGHAPDGLFCDAAGRLWACAGDAVHVLAPDGRALGRIRVPGPVRDVCLGGPEGRTLFVAAGGAVHALELAP